ncbi:MAG TPA: glycosyltransferase [Flavitalea sp.]|nr:glycosyltransferase [Flavitalea sp.]
MIKIKYENNWLRGFLNENKVNAVISDNRYGLCHPNVACILITHQLKVRSGYGIMADRAVQKFLYRFINRFTACWVPDFETKSGLAGILSHPQKLPSIPVKYLGPISRFEKCTATIQKKYDLLVIISGPEPQRSVFENKIFQQSASSAKEIVIVRGLPGDKSVSSNKNVTIFNHLNAGQLNKLICESELIICRSGYTSIMDMMKLKKKMILVPTPGQPEQEYLAAYLTQNHYALGISQKDFSLDKAVTLAASFTFNHIDTDTNDYKPILKEFLQTISS